MTSSKIVLALLVSSLSFSALAASEIPSLRCRSRETTFLRNGPQVYAFIVLAGARADAPGALIEVRAASEPVAYAAKLEGNSLVSSELRLDVNETKEKSALKISAHEFDHLKSLSFANGWDRFVPDENGVISVALDCTEI